jgi:hypothetical protein
MRLALRNSLILSLLFCAFDVEGQETGRVVGRVIAKSTGQPLANVNVIVRETPWGAVTDSAGYFEIRGLPSDTYAIEFRYVGYKTKFRAVQIGEGEELQLDVVLEEEPVPLPEVVVTDTAQPELKHLSSRSVLITRAMIEREKLSHATEVLRRFVPALEMAAQRIHTETRSARGRGIQMVPIILEIDGLRIRVEQTEMMDNFTWLDKFITLEEIESMVVHRGQNAWMRVGRRGEKVDWLIEITRKRPKGY